MVALQYFDQDVPLASGHSIPSMINVEYYDQQQILSLPLPRRRITIEETDLAALYLEGGSDSDVESIITTDSEYSDDISYYSINNDTDNINYSCHFRQLPNALRTTDLRRRPFDNDFRFIRHHHDDDDELASVTSCDELTSMISCDDSLDDARKRGIAARSNKISKCNHNNNRTMLQTARRRRRHQREDTEFNTTNLDGKKSEEIFDFESDEESVSYCISLNK